MTQDLGYLSHVSVLASVLSRTTGPVLELGCGWGSTPLIHYMCRDRHVYTVESNREWMENFRHYHRRTHYFRQVGHEEMSVERLMKAWAHFAHEVCGGPVYWDVCFVDHTPGESRVPVIMALRGRVRFFVAHDVEADIPPSGGNYGWKQLEGAFKHETIMRSIRPWTAVWSDTVEFRLEEKDEWPERSS